MSESSGNPAAGRSLGDLATWWPIVAEAMEYLGQGLTIVDSDLRLVLVNRYFLKLLDFPEEMGRLGTPFDAFMRFNARRGEYGPGDVEAQVAERVEKARQFQPHRFERIRPDGTIIEIVGNPLPGGGFVTTYTDITERRRAEEAAKRFAGYMRSVLDNLPQAVSVFDENLRLAFFNEPFIRYLEFPPRLVKEGIHLDALLRYNAERGEYGQVDIDQFVAERVRLAQQFLPHQFERTRPDGAAMLVQGKPMADADGKTIGFVTTYTDISERKRAEEEMHLLATRDGLTGILSRRYFLERAAEELERMRRFHHEVSAIFMDADHFKLVNDVYGHAVGDDVLKRLAAECLDHVRGVDLVGRLGGEEFGIVLVETGLKAAQTVAERLRIAISNIKFETEQGPLSVTVSLGIAEFHEQDGDLDQLLTRADRALYAAKRAGRNRVAVAGAETDI